jgi:hypothetical protein
MLKTPVAHTAVIFVHGFGGKPTSTWINFHTLVDEYSTRYPWWAQSDMFFFSYDSLHTPIRRNAQSLFSFIETVWNGKWPGATPNIIYKYLILVGHSEGGVVIRRLVLDRYESIKQKIELSNPNAGAAELRAAVKSGLESDFVMTSSLCLFAPACMGTNFSSWLGFFASFSHFVSAIAASALVRNELMPKSPVLDNLREGTEAAHAEFKQVHSLFTRPLFGVPDQVVFSESYRGEEPFWDDGYDHFSVCKPTYTHPRPLEFVRK